MVQYRTVEGLSELADVFDEFLIDQFGVLHDGMRPYQGGNPMPDQTQRARQERHLAFQFRQTRICECCQVG